MKKNHILLHVVFCLITLSTFAQKLEQNQVEKLITTLNTDVNLTLKLNGNKGYCNVNTIHNILELRANYDIAEDSLTAKAKQDLYKERYTGPVFWKFNFSETTSEKAVFKANKYQQVFCTIAFTKQDTINIKSQLNAYTSHHKASDSFLHNVIWSGNKYVSLLLTPEWIEDKFVVIVKGITISGQFLRADKTLMAKNQIKTLRNILKREFKNMFKAEGVSQLFLNKLNE